MTTIAKVLVAGPAGGDQVDLVSTISEVKTRSSARRPDGDVLVPMHFGRVKLASDLDLQLFGFQRDEIEAVADTVSPGVVGAILMIDENDLLDSSGAAKALETLSEKGLVCVVAVPAQFDPSSLGRQLDVDPACIVGFSSLDRGAVKQIILRLLETALDRVRNTAA